MSEWAKNVKPENVWQEYPRPQFERTQWKNLNGLWDYAILKNPIKFNPKSFKERFWFLLVLNPLCQELEKVSIQMIRCGIGEVLSYQTTGGKDVVIHFEAVDYKCALWVNDILVELIKEDLIVFLLTLLLT